MNRLFFAALLAFGVALPASGQTTPYVDTEIRRTGHRQAADAAMTGAPTIGTETASSARTLPAELLAKLAIPVVENGRMQLLKGQAAWVYLQKRNPSLAKALVRLCDALLREPNVGSRMQAVFHQILDLRVTDKTLVVALPGSRFLAIDRENLDRIALFSYPTLSDDELRILENSSLPGFTDTRGQPLRGQALFEELARRSPRALLAFTNLCARLRSREYLLNGEYGTRTALSMIKSVSYQEQDRFRSACDPELSRLIATNRLFSKAPGHGALFPISFKQNNATSAGGQFCFSPDGKQVEFDIDMYNIAAKNPFKKIVGAIGHTAEVLTPGKTDPYKIHAQLQGQKVESSTPVVRYPEALDQILAFAQPGR